MDGERAGLFEPDVTPHAHPASSIGFWPLTIMWFGMMAAMMAPTVWPWVLAFHRFTGTSSSTKLAATTRFAGGYLSAWLAYSLAAAAAQLALEQGGMLNQSATGAVILLTAGLYQFAALKTACLTHCRSPLSYFLTRWRSGPAGGFQMGIHHGLFCVGCCWALMATTLAVGVMDVLWMAALAAIALVEQVTPFGRAVRKPLGGALVAAALWRLISL